MRLFTDWRGQAALSVLFAAVAVFVLVILLDGGPGFSGIIVAVNAVSALTYGYGAVITRREVIRQRQQEEGPTAGPPR